MQEATLLSEESRGWRGAAADILTVPGQGIQNHLFIYGKHTRGQQGPAAAVYPGK